jgi:hypothetical protein
MVNLEVLMMPALLHQPPGGRRRHRSHARGPASPETTCQELAVREADWLEPTDDDPDGAGPRRAHPLLLALASVPWLVVIALLVLPGRLGGDAASTDAASPADEHREPDHRADDPIGQTGQHAPPDAPPVDRAAEAPAGNPTADAGVAEQAPRQPGPGGDVITLEGHERRGRWRVEAGAEEAVALAVVAGRAWLTGVEPVLDLGLGPAQQEAGGGGGYAEHLVVEAVEQPAPDAVVVTLVAVVLDAEGTSPPAVRRLAIPVASTPEGPRLAGSPWDLPPPILDRVVLARQTTTDATDLEAARSALAAAGLTELDLVALHRTGGWPVIAEVTTPGTDVTREVWLRRHLGGYVVAGTTLAGNDPAPEPARPLDRDQPLEPAPDQTENRP